MAIRFQRAAYDGRPALNRGVSGEGPTVGGLTNGHRVDERVRRAQQLLDALD
jgi:hypothetical protein